MDRRRGTTWIAMVALAVTTALVAACSGGDVTGESESAIGAAGRWRPSAEALAIGANVRVTYDAAPKWTGTSACSGKLRSGSRKVGEHLLETFDAVRSIGGYACRRNTADTSRVSVHGTGRALDVFIPVKNGDADNARGDRVANWLVMNAQRIGIQLVIWDRSIWRANGTNDSPYGGPHPHDDHIHVELSDEAAAEQTAWFTDPMTADGGASDDGDASTVDASDDDDAATTDAGTKDAAADASKDAGKDAAKDASPATTDAGMPDEGEEGNEGDPAEEEGTVTEPPSSGAPPSDGYELPEGDEPEESDSLGDTPAKKNRPGGSYTLDPLPDTSGCSAARTGAPASAGLGAFGVLLALAFVSRRRR